MASREGRLLVQLRKVTRHSPGEAACEALGSQSERSEPLLGNLWFYWLLYHQVSWLVEAGCSVMEGTAAKLF